MKVLQQRTYTGKNLSEVFELPCVKAVIKFDGKPVLVLWRDVVRGDKCIVFSGNTLVQYTNGTWSIE